MTRAMVTEQVSQYRAQLAAQQRRVADLQAELGAAMRAVNQLEGAAHALQRLLETDGDVPETTEGPSDVHTT
jgi:hypothetical protein